MLTIMHRFVRAYADNVPEKFTKASIEDQQSAAASSSAVHSETDMDRENALRPTPVHARRPAPLAHPCSSSGSDARLPPVCLLRNNSHSSMRSMVSQTSSDDGEMTSLYRLLDVDPEIRMAY